MAVVATGPLPRAVCSIRKVVRAFGRPGTELSINRGKFSRDDSQAQAMIPLERVAVSGRSVRGPLSVLEVPVTGMEPGATGVQTLSSRAL